MSAAERKRAVLLVDDKKRDLMMAALLAWQLRGRGVDCFLEPLEAYRGVLAAHRPHMIIFNHIVASHLVEYSRRLGAMGVLTAVLLNEGLCYDDGVREYNAGKHHKGAHIDYFFCWNQPLKDALERFGFGGTHIEVAGPPRYDFYSPPWSTVFDDYRWPSRGKPKLLVCSNFGLAKFHDAPPAEGQRLFAAWAERIPAYRDWRGIIAANHRAQRRFLDFLDAIVRSGKFDVVLRPHPREDLDLYRRFLAALPPEAAAGVRMDASSNITSLILACDAQVGCENCNTTMESWIAGKPTVELVFERHPVFYNPMVAALAPNCERPEEVVGMIEAALREPAQAGYAAARQAHLDKWCAGPSGKATERIAAVIAGRLRDMAEPDWSQLTRTDRRRALKLKLLHRFGKAYHYRPFLGLRARLLGGRHKLKAYNYAKAVTPADAAQALALLDARLR